MCMVFVIVLTKLNFAGLLGGPEPGLRRPQGAQRDEEGVNQTLVYTPFLKVEVTLGQTISKLVYNTFSLLCLAETLM